MVVRRVTETDMPQILELVDSVFSGEQGIPRWMNPVPPEKLPLWWCVESDSRIVGAAVAYWDEGVCHMGRIAVAPEMRGRGIGTKLLRHALAELFAEQVESVRMEARDATVRILRRMGAEIAGEPFGFYGANCTPIVLRRENFIVE